ncbi:MAG TPA: NAD-dependent dehydratase, partial [Nitrospina sp.]|nr:NAD-dependent dehydratase [Nitrospina sp.]
MVDILLEKGFQVRIIDNLICGRESNLEHQVNNSNLSFEKQDIRDLESTSLIFK